MRRASGAPRALAAPLAAVGIALAGAPADAGEGRIDVDPAKSEVHFTLGATLHTVHGTGRVTSGALVFDPAGGPASGPVVVDARSFVTGIAQRDRDMHAKVLESTKYPEIRFDAERLDVKARSADAADVTLHGVLTIHGGRHAVEVPGRVAREGEGVRIEASFRVPYAEWGMTDVSNFVLRVDPFVDVQLALRGTLSLPEGESRPNP